MFSNGLLLAQEYTGMLESDDIGKEGKADHAKTPFFVQVGVVITDGSMFNDSSQNSGTYPFTHTVNFEQDDISSTGVIAAIGVKLRQGKRAGTQFIGVIKSGTDSINSTSLRYTQFGSALELYMGSQHLQFLLGTLLSIGTSEHPAKAVDSLYYFALEPYIGLNINITDNFTLVTKLGYEWRDYEKVSYNDHTTSHHTKLDAYTVTGTLALQYNF